LFRFAFLKNCLLDEDEANSEDHRTLEELSPLEILDNFSDLVEDLLNYKENTKHSEGNEVVQRALKLEKQLQKTEAEVRKHIRVEQQMRLHMESAQAQIEVLENHNKRLERDLSGFKAKAKEQDSAKRSFPKSRVLEIESKLNSDISSLHKKLETSQAEGEAKKQRKLFELKGQTALYKQIEGLKKRLEMKERECNKYLVLLRSRDSKPRETSRNIRNSNHSSRRSSLGEIGKVKEDTKIVQSGSQGRLQEDRKGVKARQVQIRGMQSARSLSENSRRQAQVLLS
jgi:hypothetical protein